MHSQWFAIISQSLNIVYMWKFKERTGEWKVFCEHHTLHVFILLLSQQLADSLTTSLVSASPLNCLLITASLVPLGCNSLHKTYFVPKKV